MAFISVAEELNNKSATLIENKFIKKYLPELEPVSVKVYLYAVYVSQSGKDCSCQEFAEKLNLTEDKLYEYLEYLDEFELIAVTSRSPLEIKILDCENYYGKPKKLHPEKYDGLYDELQAIISGRMISQDEFREYLILLEEYGFERNALVMIVNYCVNLKGADIGGAYIRKVAKNFASDGVSTAAKVEERLSSYTLSTSSLLKIFTACSIKRRPEIEDGEMFKKWTSLGFDEDGIICAAKCFKVKKMERLDAVLSELEQNRKFAPKEIDDYKKQKDTLTDIAISTAKALGVYMSDATPYVCNYVTPWLDMGFSGKAIEKIASYCFLSGRNSYDRMNDFILELYKEAYVDDVAVDNLLNELLEDDKFIKLILSSCGLTRKIISYDRQALGRWREWGFNESMILKAAEISSGKSNPVAAMNYLLSSWKNAGIYSIEKIPEATHVYRSGRKKQTNSGYGGILDESMAAMERAALKDKQESEDD